MAHMTNDELEGVQSYVQSTNLLYKQSAYYGILSMDIIPSASEILSKMAVIMSSIS